MSELDDLYQILFEISNDNRHKILLLLDEKPMNITQISKTLNLRLPEVSRHLARLSEVDLTWKDPDGLYHVSNYCRLVLNRVKDLQFTTKHKKYFNIHHTSGIPEKLMKRIGELYESVYIPNAINFLHRIEKLFTESEDFLWFIGDEYIINAYHHIQEAVKRGVDIKIIEPENYSPSFEQDTLKLSASLEKRTLEPIKVFLYVSEKMAALSLPVNGMRFDYIGFSATDRGSIQWCKDLFLNLWRQAKPRRVVSVFDYKKSRQSVLETSKGKVIIEGSNDPTSDYKVVQEAVDNYNEVILRGVFNLGSQGILVSRSCVIKGEGRDKGVPLTKMYKSKWQIPFTTDEWLIRSKGVETDVTIENLHFTDFNGTCIEAYGGNSITIKDNRITLETGYARGRRHHYGDLVVGINVGRFGEKEADIEYYPVKVKIEGNYIDFALSYLRGGYIPRSTQWEDPGYHPNPLEEYYLGAGIFINHVEGHVLTQDNVVKNMNALGINASDCMDSANINILKNNVSSDIFGAHSHGEAESGCGITVHSAASFRDRRGFKFNISDNTLNFSKPLYVGIRVAGPFNAPTGSGKFKGGTVKKNSIQLENGYVGIKVGRSDNIKVLKNVITGNAYYGIRVHAQGSPRDVTMYSDGNIIMNNEMKELTIKDTDEYINDNSDGIIFPDIKDSKKTANIWLDKYSNENEVKLKEGEIIINEGKNNKISII